MSEYDAYIDKLENEVVQLEAENERLKAQLLHAEAHDCTAYGDDEWGAEYQWHVLTEEQKQYWIDALKEEE